MRILRIKLLVIVFSAILKSCGMTPREVKYDDFEVQPLWIATSKISRDTLGFTPIERKAKIRLEVKSILFEKHYDLMLHIDGTTSRTIAFKKIKGDEFAWISEQEIFRGPRKYQTVDGEFNEEIVLTFYTEPISGNPLNQLIINYRGPDKELISKKNLKLDDVRPFIKDWTDR